MYKYSVALFFSFFFAVNALPANFTDMSVTNEKTNVLLNTTSSNDIKASPKVILLY